MRIKEKKEELERWQEVEVMLGYAWLLYMLKAATGGAWLKRGPPNPEGQAAALR